MSNSILNPMLQADLILTHGRVVTLDAAQPRAQAVAITGGRILAVGSNASIAPLAGTHTRRVDLGGRTVLPGLIDAHAHLDREGLKTRLPSLAGIDSIDALVDHLAGLARARPPGEWIVTMPLGDPPFYLWAPEHYREARLPTRTDLDRASREHPIFIRPPWGYWPSKGPLPAIANSAALARAGVDRTTQSPSAKLVIDRDARGEPTGVLWEHERMPLAEFTLFSAIPGFGEAERHAALLESMRAYNSFGTTSVIEAHGVAPQVLNAWQRARDRGQLGVRAHLMMSPGWGRASAEDVRTLLADWLGWLRGRGLGDDWLRVAGLYTEIDAGEERLLRARCAPQTGWAGFLYDSAIPADAVRALMLECARNGIRVSGVYANLLELFAETHAQVPIDGQRWVLGHQMTLDASAIARIRDLGLALTFHPGAHIGKRGAELARQVGPARANEVCPIASALAAGIPASFCTDNVPVSLWYAIACAVTRLDRNGQPIAPDQAIDVENALRCATTNGAWASFEEQEKGQIRAGMLADIAVLDRDPFTTTALADTRAVLTVVGGRIVHSEIPEVPESSTSPHGDLQ